MQGQAPNYFKTSVIFTLVAGVGQCELSHCWISARTQVLAARQVLAASQKQNQDPRNPRSSQRKNVLVRVISYHILIVLVPRLQTLYCLSKKVVLYAGPLAVNGNRAGCMHVD